MQARTKWDNIFKKLKEKKSINKSSVYSGYVLHNENKIKIFSDK